MSETESDRRRRRWINLGELIALAALLVSAAGVWISWKSGDHDNTTRVVGPAEARGSSATMASMSAPSTRTLTSM